MSKQIDLSQGWEINDENIERKTNEASYSFCDLVEQLKEERNVWRKIAIKAYEHSHFDKAAERAYLDFITECEGMYE
jgi:hypothetical protein